MKLKKGLYNVLFGVIGQVVILALGIIVPRLVLKSYGDEANGLINAIGQLFTYLAMIEAGVGQAAVQALYKPITENDKSGINGIMAATQTMFRKLTYIYFMFVVLFALLYPLAVCVQDEQTISVMGSSYLAIFLIIFFQGFSSAISFYFVATFKQILIADGRSYISVNITTLLKLMTSVLRIILINVGVNLALLQLVYVGINMLEVFLYESVFKKRYSWIDMNVKRNDEALSQRNSFVVHEIANVIFSSTDVLVLSIFCDLQAASIYAIYNLVFAAVGTLINQVHSGCYFILGQTYNEDKKRYIKVHDMYDTYYMACVFSIISVTYLLILPFVQLYTKGVTAISYIDPLLPILFCSIQLLSCCRITSSNLIKIAGHAKKTTNRAIAEAVINLSMSLLLVRFVGIYGVLIGTIVALLYRTNDMIIYSNKRILHRSPARTYRTVFVNLVGFLFVVLMATQTDFHITSYVRFFKIGLLLSGAICLSYVTINSLADRSSFAFAKSILLNRRRND